jgi:hypothetical protein
VNVRVRELARRKAYFFSHSFEFLFKVLHHFEEIFKLTCHLQTAEVREKEECVKG